MSKQKVSIVKFDPEKVREALGRYFEACIDKTGEFSFEYLEAVAFDYVDNDELLEKFVESMATEAVELFPNVVLI